MNTIKNNRLPRLVKTLLDILYGLLIFVMAGLVIMMILSPFLTNQDLALGTVSIPVKLGIGDEPRMEVSFLGSSQSAINQAFVEGAQGVLRVETDSLPLILLAYGSKLLMAAGLTYLIFILRKILRAVLAGEPFSSENSALIRKLGSAVLAIGFLSIIVEGLAAVEVLRLLPATTPRLAASTTFDPGLVLGSSLFIFLLAQIWSYGMELEQEQALTV